VSTRIVVTSLVAGLTVMAACSDGGGEEATPATSALARPTASDAQPVAAAATVGVPAAGVSAPAGPPADAASAAPGALGTPVQVVAADGEISVEPSGASAPAVRVAAPPRSLLVVATGDVLTEQRVLDSGAAGAGPGERYDFSWLLDPITPIIESADLAICHMELPIGAPGARPGVYGRSPNGGNLLLAPYELAASMKDAGFDRCSTASNHANDLGTDGITSTLEALDDVGLGHTGTARSEAEAHVEVFTVNRVAVAHLSYTTFANSPPLAEPWMNFAGSADEVIAAVQAVRAAGAEIVILSLHIAKEMLSAPMGYDRKFVADITAAARVDLVVEHGPHVIQPIETVNGTLVYWSVGNLLTAMGVPGTGKYEDQRTLDGIIAGARFSETAAGTFTVEAWPVLMCNERSSRVVYAPLVALSDESTPPAIRPQLEACVERSIGLVPDLH